MFRVFRLISLLIIVFAVLSGVLVFSARAQSTDFGCVQVDNFYLGERYLFDIRTGKQIAKQTYDPQRGPQPRPEISPDGRYIADSGYSSEKQHYIITIERVEDSKVIFTTDAADGGTTWSPDSTKLAYTRYEKTAAGRKAAVAVYDILTNKTFVNTFEGYSNSYGGLVWSPDGKQLAAIELTLSPDAPNQEISRVYVFSSSLAMTQQFFVPGHYDAIRWVPYGDKLAISAVVDPPVLFSIADGTTIPLAVNISSAQGAPWHIRWSPDGGYVLAYYSASDFYVSMDIYASDGTQLFQDVLVSTIDDGSTPALAWANPVRLTIREATSLGIDNLTVFDLPGRQRRTVEGITSYALSSDGRFAATITYNHDRDEKVRIIYLHSFHSVPVYADTDIVSVDFNTHSGRLLTVNVDGHIVVYSLLNGREMQDILSNPNLYGQVQWSNCQPFPDPGGK